MTDQTLRAALLKLRGKGSVPASQFTPAQRNALDRFARQTGAVSCQRQGRGDLYCICDPAVFETHVIELSPQVEPSVAQQLPLRAQHVAHARNSKARHHQHASYYPLLKAVGDSVTWREDERDAELALGAVTRDFGAATICIQPNDAWHTEQALWLVEIIPQERLGKSTTGRQLQAPGVIIFGIHVARCRLQRRGKHQHSKRRDR